MSKEHDRDLARHLATCVAALPNQCFRNSVLALTYAPGAHYVEGLLHLAPLEITITHGWLELGDVLLDVTLLDEDAACYTPVFRYPQQVVYAQAHHLLPLYDNQRATRAVMHRVEAEYWRRQVREVVRQPEPEPLISWWDRQREEPSDTPR